MSQQIDFRSAASLRRRSRLSPAALMLAGVLSVVALAAGLARYEQGRLRVVETEAGAIARSLKELESAHERLRSAERPNTRETENEAALTNLLGQLKSREAVVAALRGGAIGTTGGFSRYMEALSRQAMDGVWLTGFDLSDGGSQITLSGRALHAALLPEYLSRLSREAVLAGRTLESMVVTEQSLTNSHPAGPKDSQPLSRKEPRYVQFTVSSGGAADRGVGRAGTADVLSASTLADMAKPREPQP
jgi:Fimbrial assembly protein (PilN)